MWICIWIKEKHARCSAMPVSCMDRGGGEMGSESVRPNIHCHQASTLVWSCKSPRSRCLADADGHGVGVSDGEEEERGRASSTLPTRARLSTWHHASRPSLLLPRPPCPPSLLPVLTLSRRRFSLHFISFHLGASEGKRTRGEVTPNNQ